MLLPVSSVPDVSLPLDDPVELPTSDEPVTPPVVVASVVVASVVAVESGPIVVSPVLPCAAVVPWLPEPLLEDTLLVLPEAGLPELASVGDAAPSPQPSARNTVTIERVSQAGVQRVVGVLGSSSIAHVQMQFSPLPRTVVIASFRPAELPNLSRDSPFSRGSKEARPSGGSVFRYASSFSRTRCKTPPTACFQGRVIIFGYATATVPLYSGDFHCPSCAQSRPFVREAIRKHFTLCFIKLFPFGEPLHEYIRCQGCDGTFALAAENHDPDARTMEVLEQHRRLISLALVHAERTGPGARAALHATFGAVSPHPIGGEQIDKDIRFAQGHRAPLRRVLMRETGHFGLHQKVFLLKTLATSIAADEPADRKAADVLAEVSRALGLPVVEHKAPADSFRAPHEATTML